MEDVQLKQGLLEVRDPATAALLVHPKAVVALAPFLECERALSEAAAVAGMKLPTMAYWVKRLLAVGVLEETRRRQRAGSAIRYYQSRGAVFFVPYAALPPTVVEAFRRRNTAELEQRLERALAEVYGPWGEGWGLRIGLHPTGKAAINQVTGVGAILDPAAFGGLNVWDGLPLSAEDALSLQRELYAVLERYRGRIGQTYLVRIAVAPVAE